MKVSKIVFFFLVHIVAFAAGSIAVFAYSNSGYKWSGPAANYYINNTFAASFKTAMQSADATWDNAGSKFRFNYKGTTVRNPNVWAINYDSYNDIGFFAHGNIGVVAIAGTTSNASSPGKIISETDTTINTSVNYTTVGAANSYDVRNVMTHEFGHWLKLSDLSSGWSPSWCGWGGESTMCGVIYYNETNKRSLESDDKNGIKAIYGT